MVAEHPVPAFLADALEAPVAVAVDASRHANTLLTELPGPETDGAIQLC